MFSQEREVKTSPTKPAAAANKDKGGAPKASPSVTTANPADDDEETETRKPGDVREVSKKSELNF